jgi:hypothetical protein
MTLEIASMVARSIGPVTSVGTDAMVLSAILTIASAAKSRTLVAARENVCARRLTEEI